jgi:hypothetical protein
MGREAWGDVFSSDSEGVLTESAIRLDDATYRKHFGHKYLLEDMLSGSGAGYVGGGMGTPGTPRLTAGAKNGEKKERVGESGGRKGWERVCV